MGALASVQANCAILQRRVTELEELLSKVMAENIELTQKAARATALQEQIDRIMVQQTTLPPKANMKVMDACYETELEKVNAMLQERLDEVAKQRDECMQAAVQTKLLRDMNEQKNTRILELNRQVAELQMQLEVEKAKGLSPTEDASKAVVDELISKNAALEAEKLELENKNKTLETMLAQTEGVLSVVRAENSVYDRSVESEKLPFELIETRVRELSSQAFKTVNDRMNELSSRIHKLEMDLRRASEMGESELMSTISDLQDEIKELQESDSTPKLVKMKMQIAELEEENRRLMSLSH